MTATHIVRKGEHLGMIARKFGFSNFSVLWEHPENAKLKDLRKDPTLLAPGDEVFIPDRVQLMFTRATHETYDFRVRVDKLSLKLRFFDLSGAPRKDMPVVIEVEAPETDAASAPGAQKLATDGDGKLSVDVAKHAATGSIEIDGVKVALKIGALDPIETTSGVAQRLANLGYPVAPDAADGSQAMRLAIEEFQADNDQSVTGKRADIEPKLEEVYGG